MQQNNTPKTLFLLKRENFVESIIADITSFLALVAPLFLNHYYLGSKWYIDIFFLFLTLVYMGVRVTNKSNKFKSKEDLIKYLTEIK